MQNDIFKVPKHYFEELPALIETKIAQESPLTFGRQKHIFTLPAQYFETLPAQIQQKLAPLAYLAGKVEDTLPVPAQYFENLSHQILRKVNQSKPKPKASKVIPYLKWSLATVLILMISFNVWRTQDTTPTKNDKIVAKTLPKPEILPKIEKEPVKQGQEKIQEITVPKTEPAIVILPQTQKEDALAQYLSKADSHTEEAIATLTSHEDEEESMSEAQTEEDILHNISEEEIKTFIEVLKTNKSKTP